MKSQVFAASAKRKPLASVGAKARAKRAMLLWKEAASFLL
jgi:hypothetical protein